MKYCPYCGVSLSGGAASFCPECGKALQGRAEDVRWRGPVSRQRAQAGRQAPRRPRKPADENYDGYYNDVKPIDADRAGKQSDPDLVKRIACVVAGAVGVIALAVILMVLL